MSNYKKPILLILGLIIVIIILTFVKLESNKEVVEEYQFPLQSSDIESVLAEQNINWYITNTGIVDDSRIIYTLKNDENITLGIDAWVKDNHKILSLSWLLPSSLNSDEVNNFFKNELQKHFELAGIFYGNKKSLDKALYEMISYYFDEENNEKGIHWEKRVGNDHIKAQINPTSENEKNKIISLLIMPNELYEDYLKSINDAWKEAAEVVNIKIFNSTVDEIKKATIEEIPSNPDIFSKHFVVNGHLENIKENRKVAESLVNVKSNFLKPNKDKYLSATLVDETGSINVFVQMTSLNSEELSMNRNHNVVMLYSNNEPIYVVRFSPLYSEELRAQEIVKDFIRDLYTVNSEEVKNYESALNITTPDAKVLAEAMMVNDEVLKSLMSDKAYETLVKNRENLMFTQACHEGNYTMNVAEVKLSENKNNIENNHAGYNFEVQLNYVSNDGTVTTGTAKGLIELDKIDGRWRVTGYKRLS